MKKALFGVALVLALAPLAGCNQQRGGKHQAVQERSTQGAETERSGGTGRRERGGRGHGLRRVCADELQKYCAGGERGRERRECLQSHLDQLSTDCKAAVEARGERKHRRD